ncbi:hypothetical protein Tco_0428780 [Tanacetum coccineum]
MESVVSELEGTLLKNNDPFAYFMLVAFEASGLIRFALLLLFWPVIKLLDICGKGDMGVKVAIFVSTVGVPISEIESVARAVLPKFYFDDIDLDAWRVFNSGGKRVVVTKMPRVMVERFVKEHLRADYVIGSELMVSWFGLASGLVEVSSIHDRVAAIFEDRQPSLTLMDPIVLSSVLQRRIPAVTYSISRLSEILSPIPTVRLTRIRDVDAQRIKKELSEGDLVVCPEGTTCREPFLLRFSALFAELTDRIVPVAMNYRVGFFHATTARGWKGLDPVFFFMNPRPIYEVTFLNQLPAEATCSSGKSPHDVANYVQRILAATLGFECTNFTRKDKYRVLAGNDGTVSYISATDQGKKIGRAVKKVFGAIKPFILN